MLNSKCKQAQTRRKNREIFPRVAAWHQTAASLLSGLFPLVSCLVAAKAGKEGMAVGDYFLHEQAIP
jgi:hypothetical protein